jgi:hypothetical protein
MWGSLANLGKLTFALRGSEDRAPTIVTETNERQVFEDGHPGKPIKHTFRGHARGPNGETWIYSEDQGWMQTAQPTLPSPKPSPSNGTD